VLPAGGYVLSIGIFVTLLIVPWVAWDWNRNEWRHPKVAAVLLWIGGVMIGYGIGVGPG
jgi:hypothetical protein